MHVLLVQYGGDYREAVQRFDAGGDETYGYQHYSVDAVAKLQDLADQVTVVCCLTQERYCETLSNGVQAVGTGYANEQALQANGLVDLVAAHRPDRLIIRTPQLPVLRWAIRQGIPTLPMLADSFQTKTLRHRLKGFAVSRILNHPTFAWVADHNVNSCLTLKAIGVKPEKILPWDWPSTQRPDQVPVKHLPPADQPLTLFYAGMLSELKGVGDLIGAIAQVRQQGIDLRVQLAGKGDAAAFQQQAHHLGVADRVDFLGLIPTHEVASRMRAATLVAVPSRREYPEGFPKTINEALGARTPLVTSDHPVFQARLQHRHSAMIFPSGQPAALAQCILELAHNPSLYAALSEVAPQTWDSLQIPLKWGDLIYKWTESAPDLDQTLATYSLTSGRYQLG